MLPRQTRMNRAVDFKATVTSGARKKAGPLVLYRREVDGSQVKVGFIVGKEVGNAVARHRLQRRLRHLVRSMPSAPIGTHTVVRCLPGSAELSFAEVSKKLSSVW